MNLKKEIAVVVFIISFGIMLLSLNLILGIYWVAQTREFYTDIALPTITFILSFAGLLYGLYLYRRD